MIDFNRPHLTGKEAHYMYQAVSKGKLSGNGDFTKKCQQFFQDRYGFKKCLLTTSGTDALEMCAMLCDLKPGDEVIIPSYTFVSTALAFLREGAKVVFADSMKRNPNLDADTIESFLTPRTKVIVPVHYAGVACDMDKIMEIANCHNLLVVEDAAQAIDSYYIAPSNSPKGGEFGWQTSDLALYQILKTNAKENRNNPTQAEETLWHLLKSHNLNEHFRRQHIIMDYIADFVCLKRRLIIEADGGYHFTSEQKQEDAVREKRLRKKGFEILRFTNDEVLCNPDGVVARIKDVLNSRPLWGSQEEAARPLGGIGHLGAMSFHETKNITAGGEGGLLVVNDERFIRRAEILWEKGTNRAEFFRGAVNKYGWVDMGSSFLPAEINAAFLWAQLENLDEIQNKRKLLWNTYYENLKPLALSTECVLGKGCPKDGKGAFTLPDIPDYATNNAHMFYLVCRNLEERTALIKYLKEHDIQAVFHYLSLHSSEFYKNKHDGRELPECDRYMDTLVRLPLFYDLEIEEVERICATIKQFFEEK